MRRSHPSALPTSGSTASKPTGVITDYTAVVRLEGTGANGAGLARQLREAGMLIVEVDRPDRRARRAHGKSDPLDAYSAARAALSGAAAVVPKLRNGRVEAIRALRVARSSAVKARSQAMNQIKSLIVTGHLPTLKMIAACARLGHGSPQPRRRISTRA